MLITKGELLELAGPSVDCPGLSPEPIETQLNGINMTTTAAFLLFLFHRHHRSARGPVSKGRVINLHHLSPLTQLFLASLRIESAEAYPKTAKQLITPWNKL